MKKIKNSNLTIHFFQKTKYKINFGKIKESLKKVIQKHCQGNNIEMGIHFVDKTKIMKLNKKFRKINQPTDVLSFPQIKLKMAEFTNIGDVIICPRIARINAHKFNHSIDQEILFLAEHGTKHLLGIHHE